MLFSIILLSCSKEEDESPKPKPSDTECFKVESYTQQLPNMSFDSWGFPDSSDGAYRDPCGGVWTSSNAISNSFITQSTVIRSSESVDGDFSAQIETKSFLGAIIFPGVLFNGRFKSYTFNIADALQDVEFGVPFTEKPVGLTGMHTYTSVAGDSAYIAVMLSKYNTATKQKDTVGFGDYTVTSSVNTFSPFTLNMDYSYAAGGEVPDSVLVIYTSSKGFQELIGSAGSTLVVDKCAFVY